MNWKDGSSKQEKEQKEKLLQYGKENEDYVVCKKCGKRLRQVDIKHLRVCLPDCKTIDDYKILYPNVRVRCKNFISGFQKISKEDRKENAVVGNIISKERDKYHIYKTYGKEIDSLPTLCKCGCGQSVKRSELYPYNWNKFIHNHHYKEGMKQLHKKMKKENPEKYYIDHVNGGHIAHKNMKEKDPIAYSELQRKRATDFHKKNPNFASENSKKMHKMHPGLGLRAYEGRIKNAPWYFMGVPFGSGQERDIAKLRFEILGIIPIKEENCHVRISRKEFDFEQLGFVHEHHPEQQYKGEKELHPKEDYYKLRREVLDNNGHKKSELIVTTKVKEARNIYRWLEKRLDIKENINKEVL